MVATEETFRQIGGGWDLAKTPASWADGGTFHRENCAARRFAPAHFGTFAEAAEKIIRPCLMCWPVRKEMGVSKILDTWAAIIREKVQQP